MWDKTKKFLKDNIIDLIGLLGVPNLYSIINWFRERYRDKYTPWPWIVALFALFCLMQFCVTVFIYCKERKGVFNKKQRRNLFLIPRWVFWGIFVSLSCVLAWSDHNTGKAWYIYLWQNGRWLIFVVAAILPFILQYLSKKLLNKQDSKQTESVVKNPAEVTAPAPN